MRRVGSGSRSGRQASPRQPGGRGGWDARCEDRIGALRFPALVTVASLLTIVRVASSRLSGLHAVLGHLPSVDGGFVPEQAPAEVANWSREAFLACERLCVCTAYAERGCDLLDVYESHPKWRF
jgi:hypothetical protein